MDLNVKLQGLKYNFGKIRGVFAKIRCSGFSRIFGIILLKKNHGIGPRDCRSGAHHCFVGDVHSLLNPNQRVVAHRLEG
jgi:hypothetical protein